MISKAAEYKNGYILGSSSTNKDLQSIFKGYDEVKCLICNYKTSKNFRTGVMGRNVITINNRVSDGCFFVNGVF